MTVTTILDRQIFPGDGSNKVFPFNFRFLSNSDINVYLISSTGLTPQTLGIDYSLTGVGLSGGGTVTMVAAPPINASLLVRREMLATQETSIRNQGRFYPEIHENVFDRLTMLIQQSIYTSEDGLRRSVRTPIGESITELPIAISRANTVLGFDSLGNPISVIPVSGSSADLALSLANKTDPAKGMGQLGYKGRTGAQRLGDIVSVKDFGAVGDGVTDDTLSIQNAINYAGTFDSAFGCSVFFPRGDYLFSTVTINKSHVKLYSNGDARMIKSGANNAGIIIGGLVDRIYGNSISGLAFSSKIAGTSGAQVHAINCGQMVFENIVITSFPAAPYNGLLLERVSQATIGNSSITQCKNEGVGSIDCVDIYINKSRSDANGTYGFSFRTCSGVYASQCTAYGNLSSGFYTDNTVIVPTTANGNLFHFYTNCISDTSGQHNWLIKSLDSSQLTACWGSSQKDLTGTFWCGFTVTGCNGIDLTGCIALNNNSDGVLVVGGSTDIKINGGRYAHNGMATSAGNRNGVHIGSGSSVVLDSVRMTDYAVGDAGHPKVQVYGLKVDNAVTSLTVTSCDMTGNLTGPYQIDSVPAYMMESVNKTGESIDVASANVVTVPWFGSFFSITGTTNINGISAQWPGRELTLVFRGALTVAKTGTLKIASNFVTTANSTLSMVSDGTNIYETSRSIN